MSNEIEMSDKAREAASSLAIAYSTFNEIRNSGDSKKIAIWAQKLLGAQYKTDIEMCDPGMLLDLMDAAAQP